MVGLQHPNQTSGTDYFAPPSSILCFHRHLPPALHISFLRSLFQIFFGQPLPLWPCNVHCSAWWLPSVRRGWYCFQLCLFVTLSVCLSVNMVTPEPLQTSSTRKFRGIILWSKRQTSSEMAI